MFLADPLNFGRWPPHLIWCREIIKVEKWPTSVDSFLLASRNTTPHFVSYQCVRTNVEIQNLHKSDQKNSEQHRPHLFDCSRIHCLQQISSQHSKIIQWTLQALVYQTLTQGAYRWSMYIVRVQIQVISPKRITLVQHNRVILQVKWIFGWKLVAYSTFHVR